MYPDHFYCEHRCPVVEINEIIIYVLLIIYLFCQTKLQVYCMGYIVCDIIIINVGLQFKLRSKLLHSIKIQILIPNKYQWHIKPYSNIYEQGMYWDIFILTIFNHSSRLVISLLGSARHFKNLLFARTFSHLTSTNPNMIVSSKTLTVLYVDSFTLIFSAQLPHPHYNFQLLVVICEFYLDFYCLNVPLASSRDTDQVMDYVAR